MTSLVQRLLRALYARYVTEPSRNSLRVHLALLARDREPRRMEPPRGRVVVLAPHMDDEVFGCGGTLALAARAGAKVTTVHLTDGRKGYAKGRMAGRAPSEIEEFERSLGAMRHAEAVAAARILGLEPPRFLDLPDGSLAVTADAVRRLADALRALDAEHVFLPFFTDIHHDHWLSNGVFVEAAATAGLSAAVACWGYEVWTPAPANSIVDVSDVVSLKRRALAAFPSQQAEYDYARAMEALTVYRSLFTRHGQGFAEAFYVADLALYSGLYRAIAVGHRRPTGTARAEAVLTGDATRA